MPSNIGTPQDTFFLKNNKGISLNLDEPVIMGILNVTPDSFFDGGQNIENEAIIEKVNLMQLNGAKIIDIGGYSTRPNAQEVSEEEELKRVIPIIELISNQFPDLIISIDTFRSNVAKKAVDAGADLINDISGGNLDSNMFKTVSELNVPYILMHIKGTPETMQNNPTYDNVVEEVKEYFTTKINELNDLGTTNIILDLGFGFGKTVEHNYQLLNAIKEFNSFGLPILTGISRKSMINKVIGTIPEEALNGTTVLNTIALLNGTKILRVHDVKEANECLKLVEKLKKNII
ncbi:MAG: dihydropteroate synthase [Vicingaceae bacterium]|nr:dihydropteroate synthase [Vicingaceae bacterium]